MTIGPKDSILYLIAELDRAIKLHGHRLNPEDANRVLTGLLTLLAQTLNQRAPHSGAIQAAPKPAKRHLRWRKTH